MPTNMPKNKPKRHSQKLVTSDSLQKTSIPSTPQKLPSSPVKLHKFNIIAYEYVELQSEEDIETVAKEILGRAMESAKLGEVGEMATYGNEEGRDLLKDRHDLREDRYNMMEMMKRLDTKIERLEDQMANKDTKIERLEDRMVNKDTQIADLQTQIVNNQAQHEAHITDLQDRVKTLTKDAEGYHGVRHRFIDVYRRDHFGGLTREGKARIHGGNIFAHEGDATADARLYTTGQRNDADAVIDLYGLTVDQISFLDKAGINCSITTLNKGAGWIAKGRANIPADVVATFQAFTTELIANLDQSLTDQSLTDDTTALGRANRAFLRAHFAGLRQRRQKVT